MDETQDQLLSAAGLHGGLYAHVVAFALMATQKRVVKELRKRLYVLRGWWAGQQLPLRVCWARQPLCLALCCTPDVMRLLVGTGSVLPFAYTSKASTPA
jgi:hypothetical protein